MDSFDLKPVRRINQKSLIWNILTGLVLIAACCLASFFLNLYLNPDAAPGFLRPPVLPTLFQTSTPTFTIIPLEPTWTSTITIEPTASRTRAFTWTPLPGIIPNTPTLTPNVSPTETPAISPTPMPASAEITYQANTTIYPDAGCDWLGVGGRVLDADGDPLQFQTVELGGTLAGQLVSRSALSGNALIYGNSGFELVLADHPIASSQTLWIQLLDEDRLPLTGKIPFDTYESCSQNLIMVVFTKNR